MNRATLIAIVRIAILCCAPFSVHTLQAQAAAADPELAGAAYQSFLQRRLIEVASNCHVPPQEFVQNVLGHRLTESA